MVRIIHQIVKYSGLIFLLAALNIFLPGRGYGQDSMIVSADTGCIQRDLGDAIRNVLHKPVKNKPEKSGSLLLLPIMGSNPALGFMVGVGGQYTFKMPGSPLFSNFAGSLQFTTKSQMILMLKNSIYTKDNRIFFNGDWRYLIYSQSTYGLGTNAPVGGLLEYQYNLMGTEITSDSLIQPMKFNFIRFHQLVSFRIREGIYAGFGYNFDSYFNIIDKKLRLPPGDTFLTSHYAYNTKYGFNTEKYSVSALNVNLVFNTRDNMINAYKGIYALISWRRIFKFMGNNVNTNFFQFEWKSFHGLSKSNPRHLLAFWGMGSFSKAGEFPYLTLPATGYDQFGRSGRGYIQGRFRGANLVYGEAEYRFPLSKCGGILGGVLFLNGTTTDNKAQSLKLFDSVKPGYGFGFRIMANKMSRTNFAVDFGFGEKSFGFYLAASETF